MVQQLNSQLATQMQMAHQSSSQHQPQIPTQTQGSQQHTQHPTHLMAQQQQQQQQQQQNAITSSFTTRMSIGSPQPTSHPHLQQQAQQSMPHIHSLPHSILPNTFQTTISQPLSQTQQSNVQPSIHQVQPQLAQQSLPSGSHTQSSAAQQQQQQQQAQPSNQSTTAASLVKPHQLHSIIHTNPIVRYFHVTRFAGTMGSELAWQMYDAQRITDQKVIEANCFWLSECFVSLCLCTSQSTLVAHTTL
jgi:hypothetical protein